MLGTIQGAMVRAVPPASMVWPAGSERTTALLISKQSRQCRSIIACGRRGVYPAVFHRTGLLDISLRSMRRRKLSSECRIRDNGLARSMKRFFTRLQADLTFLRGVWRVLRL